MQTPVTTAYAELHCISNFTFLRGASRPEELVRSAAELGYSAIAITDECSLAGVVKAHVEMHRQHQQSRNIRLLVGSEFQLTEDYKLVALAPDKTGYEDLSAFITLCRRRSEKGCYTLAIDDLLLHLQHCLLILAPQTCSLQFTSSEQRHIIEVLQALPNLWIAMQRFNDGLDAQRHQTSYRLATLLDRPMVACGDVHMHCRQRKPLQDTLTAIRLKTPVQQLGQQLLSNSERYLRPLP